MIGRQLNCVFIGLTITSTWGNGHATTYRGLIKELAKRGHHLTFLERDMPWYASNREFESLPYCDVQLYYSLSDLRERFGSLIRTADVVLIGSYVPEGSAVGSWVTAAARNVSAFYDIDTPVTLAALAAGKCEYLSPELVRRYHLYLSFTGGPTLDYIEQHLGSPSARPLYCSVDPALYYHEAKTTRWDVAYLGTFAADRQPAVENLLVEPALSHPGHRFAVAGPQYPSEIQWPSNVERIEHLPATEHCCFYNAQRFTLNLTRRDMIRAGYSPSVRLFEAAACGTPILTDLWPGLDTIFQLHSEILPVNRAQDVTSYLLMSDDQRLAIGERARKRTLSYHTAAVRAREFEGHVLGSLERLARSKSNRVALAKRPAAAVI